MLSTRWQNPSTTTSKPTPYKAAFNHIFQAKGHTKDNRTKGRAMIQRWTNAPGKFSLPDDTPAEVIIHFRSKGYYDPGKTSGPPERCYPPEGDDERTLDHVEITLMLPNGKEIKLRATEKTAQALFDAYKEEIMGIPIWASDRDDYRD